MFKSADNQFIWNRIALCLNNVLTISSTVWVCSLLFSIQVLAEVESEPTIKQTASAEICYEQAEKKQHLQRLRVKKEEKH